MHNVAQLHVRKFIDAHSGVPASPTTTGDNAMYFTDVSGLVQCRARDTGKSVWSFDVTAFLKGRGITYNYFNALTSRASPTLTKSHLYFGTLAGGYLIKLNRFTGALVWAKQVSSHPYAVLTQSPRVYKKQVFIGVASNEEQAAAFVANYTLSFVGTFNALDTKTGHINWSKSIVPVGYTGGAVWGSEPPIDVKHHSILIATGNPYSVSAAAEACRVAHVGQAVTFPDPCRAPDDLAESIVSLDLTTGKVNWQFSQSPVEAWTIACGINLPDLYFTLPRNPGACPQIPGPDIDYGMAPILVKGEHGATPAGEDTLYTGQKSGIVWANNATDGALLWSTVTGPGGAAGGLMFGSATDGRDYFYAQTNSGKGLYKLANGTETRLGHVGSLSLKDGAVKWQYQLNCFLNAPLAHSNGLVYVSCGQVAGSAPGGQMHVFDAANGKLLFSKLGTVGNRANGVSFAGSDVFLPSGYTSDVTAGGVYMMSV